MHLSRPCAPCSVSPRYDARRQTGDLLSEDAEALVNTVRRAADKRVDRAAGLVAGQVASPAAAYYLFVAALEAGIV